MCVCGGGGGGGGRFWVSTPIRGWDSFLWDTKEKGKDELIIEIVGAVFLNGVLYY